MNRRLLTALVLLTCTSILIEPSVFAASAKLGTPCSRSDTSIKVGNFTLVCKKVGKILIWTKSGAVASSNKTMPTPKTTRNANSSGIYSISQTFESIGTFSNGLAWAVILNSKKSISTDVIISATGKVLATVPNVLKKGLFSDGLSVVLFNSGWTFLKSDGTSITASRFQAVSDFSNGMAAVSINGRWGFINSQGKLVVPAQYDSARDFVGDYAFVAVNDRWGIINKSGKSIADPQFEDVRPASLDNQLQWIEKDRLWGIFNSKNGEMLKPQLANNNIPYDGRFEDFFRHGYRTLSLPENSFGVTEAILDSDGKILGTTTADYVGTFSEGLAPARFGENYGFIDTTGKLIIAAIYKDAGNFSEGLAAVRVNRTDWGYIDKLGNTVITPQFYFSPNWHSGGSTAICAFGDYFNFHNGISIFYTFLDGDGVIDKLGRFIVPLSKTQTAYYGCEIGLNENLFLYKPKDQGYGIMDTTGRVITEPFADKLYYFSEKLSAYKLRERYGFIDHFGNLVGLPLYNDLDDIYDGLASMRVGDIWGFVNSNGKVVIEPKFPSNSKFSNGLAREFDKSSGMAGYIDKSGKFVIKPQFRTALDFVDGTAMAEFNNRKWAILSLKK